MARATAAEQRLIKHCMDNTEHAYMRGGYGEVRWRREIRWMIHLGCDELEIQAIMLSKWPRWADHGGVGHHRLSSLMDRWPDSYNMQAIKDMVREYEEDDLVPLN